MKVAGVGSNGEEVGETKAGLRFQIPFKKTDLYGFSPQQLDEDMSNQVLLEKAAVASVLHKSVVHFVLKFRHCDNIHEYMNIYINILSIVTAVIKIIIIVIIIVIIKTFIINKMVMPISRIIERSRLLIKHSPLKTGAEKLG